MDLRFGTLEYQESVQVRLFQNLSRELAKHKIGLVGVQVRWDKGGTEPADD
jgi:hypothetical protein